MKIDHPAAGELPGLRSLWKTAFGDTDEFLDRFYTTAYAPERCLCATEAGAVLSALYWLDCTCGGQKLAYIYAVATDPAHRGRGLCRRLMDRTRSILQRQGYAGALLVPVSEDLIRMYSSMGYVPCTCVSEFRCEAAASAEPARELDVPSYARLRRQLLPEGGVLQEGESLAFLAEQFRFFAGDRFLAAVTVEGDKLHCAELLGSPAAAPGLLAALGAREGFFRCPGTEKPFAMFQPLSAGCPKPAYFGFAFD